jgi:antitoxin (DNA-binding transcriptional repressor) of toxin-antitoxin stability system
MLLLAILANMETTVHKAKTQLSALLKKAEEGEEVLIRRGLYGKAFKIVPIDEKPARCLEPLSEWMSRTSFEDESVWESEWETE